MKGYGKTRCCTKERRITIEFYLYLAATLTVILNRLGGGIRAARSSSRVIE